MSWKTSLIFPPEVPISREAQDLIQRYIVLLANYFNLFYFNLFNFNFNFLFFFFSFFCIFFFLFSPLFPFFIGQRIVARMRNNLFGSIIKQDVEFFDKNQTGEIINRLSADTVVVGKAVTDNVSDGLRSVAQAAVGIGMMVYMSPKLTVVVLGIVPPVFFFAFLYGRYVKKLTRQVQNSLANATQIAEERISNIRTVRAFAKEHAEADRYALQIQNIFDLGMKEAQARGIFHGAVSIII